MRKELVGCVKYVVGKSNLIVRFEDVQKRGIHDSSLPYLCDKEEFDQEIDKTIYDLPKIGQVELLTIDGDDV